MSFFQFTYDIECETVNHKGKGGTTRTLLLRSEDYETALEKVQEYIRSRKSYINDLDPYNISIEKVKASLHL